MNALFSAIIFFVTYFIPGWVSLTLLRTGVVTTALLALPIGMALWGWQAWVFGNLQVRWLSWVYVLSFLIAFVFLVIRDTKTWKRLGSRIVEALKRDKISLVLLIAGICVQSLTMWNVLTNTGTFLTSCCGDTNDNIWYASLTRELIKSVPPQIPGITNQTLHNYHYWSNLVVAESIRIFGVSQLPFQFRYTGILLSLSLGLTVIAFVRAIGQGANFRRWLLFFMYFGGDMIYLIPLLSSQNPSFVASSLEDGARFLSNLPRSYAVVISFAWLVLWCEWMKHINPRRIIFLGLILASIIGFKVYLGLFLFTGLAAASLYELIAHRKWIHLHIFIVGLIFAALVYLPVNAGAGGIIFTKFWRVENFVMQPSFKLERLELARQIFEQDNKTLKVLYFDLIFLAIYAVAVFGTKLLALLQTGMSLKQIPQLLHIFLIFSLVINFVLGIFFQQVTGGANTFNFLVNVYIFISIYVASAVTYWLHRLRAGNKLLHVLLIVMVVSLTLPRAVYETLLVIRRSGDLYPIMSEEIKEVVDYLRTTPKDTLILVKSRYLAADAMGPYMYFLSERPQYLSSSEFLEQFATDTFDRKRNVELLRTPGSTKVRRSLLKKEGIDYILLDTQEAVNATWSAYWLRPVVRTMPITLLKVDLSISPPTSDPMEGIGL